MTRTSLGGLFLFLAGAVALAAAVLLPKEDPQGQGEPAGGPPGAFRFSVTTAPVHAGAVEESIELVGDVVSARRSALAFERSGRIQSVHAEMGDRVVAGASLAKFDDAVLEQELEAAQADAVARVAQAEFAAREARRGEEMGPDVLSPADLDRRRTDAAVAKSSATRQAAEVRRLEALLHRGELRAPFDCAIERRLAVEGGYALAGAPVFDVVDLARREVHLQVPARYATRIAPGAMVRLRADDVDGFALTTVLAGLVPAADPGSRTFTGLVRLGPEDDAAQLLLPGLFVRAEVVLVRIEGQLVVPDDALIENPRGTVLVVAQAAAEAGAPPNAAFVPVRVLARQGRRAAVAPLAPGPLEDGAEVVVTGVGNLFPGAPLAATPHADPVTAGH
ncbi:MAG TPA: efflux RND transporter periplasmic adaptor subunit [Planctomycetota bacterium]